MTKHKIIGVEKKESFFKKNKTAVIAGSVIAVLLIVGIIVAVCIFSKPDADYEKVRDEYKKSNIEYSYDDYNKDKNAANSNDSSKMSDSYNQMMSANDRLLKRMSEDTHVDTDTNQLINTILAKSKESVDFIESDFGWPESKYGKEYDAAREYTRNLNKYACYGTSMKNAYEGSYTLDEQATRLEYSTYFAIPYSVTNDPGTYRGVYKSYFKAGHPRISSINSIILYSETGTINSQDYNLRAYVGTNAGTFNVFMISSWSSQSAGAYSVVDIAGA